MTPEVDRFYRTLVREAPDAILYADAQGIITFWNKAAERVFGFSEAEAGGKSLGIIIPEKLRKRHWDGFAETIRTGKTRYGAGDVLAVPAMISLLNVARRYSHHCDLRRLLRRNDQAPHNSAGHTELSYRRSDQVKSNAMPGSPFFIARR